MIAYGINYPYLIMQLVFIGLYLLLLFVTLRVLLRQSLDDWLKVIWAIVILTIPVLGAIAYWVIGYKRDSATI